MVRGIFKKLSRRPQKPENCAQVIEALRDGRPVPRDVFTEDCIACMFFALRKSFNKLEKDFEKAAGLAELWVLAKWLDDFFIDIFKHDVKELAEVYNIDCRAIYATKPFMAVLSYFACGDKRQLRYVRGLGGIWRGIATYIEDRKFPVLMWPTFERIYEPCMDQK
ncbi:MAG: hypothetical protein ACP5MH_10280 [Thermoproteus sp.]